MSTETETNDQMFLVSGESTTGKSASLKDIRHQEKWMYLNTEAGKRLPFQNNFQNFRISDPYQVHEGIEWATSQPASDIHGIIIDSLTFLMDMFETQFVINAANTQKAWGDYAQFYKDMMQRKLVQFNRPVIILAHTKSEYDEASLSFRTAVPIKGALKNNGIESYFSTVVSTKKVSLKELEEYTSDLLTITEDDQDLGFKYVFQTRLTKKTTGERIRSPMGLFNKNETFMDNNSQLLLDRLHKFYGVQG